MANKNLNSIKFPGLPDTYIVPQVDTSLSISGRPADAKKVGDEITSVRSDLTQLEQDLTNESERIDEIETSVYVGTDGMFYTRV